MVDIFGMFGRGPAKRGQQGAARGRQDITALDDPLAALADTAREQPGDQPRPRINPRSPQNTETLQRKAKPARASNGAGAPQLLRRPGFLAVHSIEKSFGSRQVVRGVSIYVRRGEAVGLLGPNGAGKTTVFYMITGLIKAERGAIERDGHDATRWPMYNRGPPVVGLPPQ